MGIALEREIENIIVETVRGLGRPDLFRRPLVSFSAAEDEGYGKLKTVIGEWNQSPAELLPGAKSVISYFVPFTKEVVSAPKGAAHGAALWAEAYLEINRHFEVVNAAVAGFLEGLGYAAKTIRATHTYDPKDLKSMWSHRSAAAIAGLGAFGTNRLLITEKGCGGRFCTVITTAQLEANTTPAENRCLHVRNGSCGLCVKICPVNALGVDSMDKFACQNELNRNGAMFRESGALGGADVCGKCISVCPVGYLE